MLRALAEPSTSPAGFHRPWPMPWWPWILSMRWHQVLFLHWPVQASLIRRALPRNLHLDTFEGQAWITISPLRMTNVRPRGTLSIPIFSSLNEVNVRTYVELGGKPGIWFFSLDANHWMGVQTGRWLFALPYYYANAECRCRDGMLAFQSARAECGVPRAAFDCRYIPTESIARRPLIGSLDHWLLERYCMYSFDEQNRLYRTDIHHEPWYVQRADARILTNTLTDPLDIPVCGDPLVHFAKRQDVIAWSPVRLTSGVKV